MLLLQRLVRVFKSYLDPKLRLYFYTWNTAVKGIKMTETVKNSSIEEISSLKNELFNVK